MWSGNEVGIFTQGARNTNIKITYYNCTCHIFLFLSSPQSNDTTSSNAMELEGLKRSIHHLREKAITISTIVTDRHRSVTAHIRDNERDIQHYFDLWHVSKGKES